MSLSITNLPGGIAPVPLPPSPTTGGAAPSGAASFKDYLLNSLDQVNSMQQEANHAIETMAVGGDVNPAEVLTAVVVSIGYLFNVQSNGAETYLLNGQSFTADEMGAMEGAFGKAGLSDYTVEGSRIKITKSRQAAFLGALADAGAMPARFGDYL